MGDMILNPLRIAADIYRYRGACKFGQSADFSIFEVIEAARRVTGREILVDYARRRGGDPGILVGDITRARRSLIRLYRHVGLNIIMAQLGDG